MFGSVFDKSNAPLIQSRVIGLPGKDNCGLEPSRCHKTWPARDKNFQAHMAADEVFSVAPVLMASCG